MLNEINAGNVPGPSDVSLELIAATGEVEIEVMVELCMKVLDDFGMPSECALCVVVQIFMWKYDIRNCSCCRVMNLLEHEMKVADSVFEKRLCKILTVN